MQPKPLEQKLKHNNTYIEYNGSTKYLEEHTLMQNVQKSFWNKQSKQQQTRTMKIKTKMNTKIKITASEFIKSTKTSQNRTMQTCMDSKWWREEKIESFAVKNCEISDAFFRRKLHKALMGRKWRKI